MIGVFELQTNVACALIRKRDLPEIVKNLLLYLTEENIHGSGNNSVIRDSKVRGGVRRVQEGQNLRL